MHLTCHDAYAEAGDALAERLGGRLGLSAVLADLDRRARRTLAPGRAVHRAWTWDRRDRWDRRWWPQGISPSASADVPGPDRVVAVSWYAKDGGSRVSFLDLTHRRYDHVQLVVPTLVDGVADHEPLKVHAGGIVWHGDHLHVAATARGFWTCRLSDVLRGPEGWVLPVRYAYRAHTEEGQERLRYSFLSLDASASPPELVVGEYGNSRQTRRIARFPLDPESSLPHTDGEGRAQPTLLDGGVVRAQGVVRARGAYYLTTSHGPWKPGSVYVGEPGAFRRRGFAVPMGTEDLAYSREDDLLWNVTEHPGRRWICALKRSWFD